MGCVLIWQIKHNVMEVFDGNVEESASGRDVLLLVVPDFVTTADHRVPRGWAVCI